MPQAEADGKAIVRHDRGLPMSSERATEFFLRHHILLADGTAAWRQRMQSLGATHAQVRSRSVFSWSTLILACFSC